MRFDFEFSLGIALGCAYGMDTGFNIGSNLAAALVVAVLASRAIPIALPEPFAASNRQRFRTRRPSRAACRRTRSWCHCIPSAIIRVCRCVVSVGRHQHQRTSLHLHVWRARPRSRCCCPCRACTLVRRLATERLPLTLASRRCTWRRIPTAAGRCPVVRLFLLRCLLPGRSTLGPCVSKPSNGSPPGTACAATAAAATTAAASAAKRRLDRL